MNQPEENFITIADVFVKYAVPQITTRRWIKRLRLSDYSKFQRVIKEEPTDTGKTYYALESWILEKMKMAKRPIDYSTNPMLEGDVLPSTNQNGLTNRISDESTNQLITENIQLKTKLEMKDQDIEKKDKIIEEKDNRINMICMEAGKWKGQYQEMRYLLAEVKKQTPKKFEEGEYEESQQKENKTNQ